MPKESLSFDPEFNLLWFNEPVFDLMFATWSEIFDRKRGGSPVVSAQDALIMLSETEEVARDRYGLTPVQTIQMSRVACKYAQYLGHELSEEAIKPKWSK